MSACSELVDEIAPIPHDFAADTELGARRPRLHKGPAERAHAQRSRPSIKRAAAADTAAISF